MFKIGQKVVCIVDYSNEELEHLIFPKKGQVYTIREIGDNGTGPWLRAVEITNPPTFWSNIDGPAEMGFVTSAFRPITDISFAHEILRKINKRVKA